MDILKVNKNIGILQPGRIGDIIISLPIAKYYNNLGYNVIWPICDLYINNFIQNIPYVNFIPLKTPNIHNTMHWHDTALNMLKEHSCDNILDLLFNMHNTDKASNGWLTSGLKFDEYRYQISNVPFTEKWNLDITRNSDRESLLFNNIVKQEKYVVCHFNGSSCVKRVPLDNIGNFQIIEISQLTDNIFDWLKIIEHASKLILLDSSFANIVEQSNYNNEKYFIKRSPDIMTPTLKNNWNII